MERSPPFFRTVYPNRNHVTTHPDLWDGMIGINGIPPFNLSIKTNQDRINTEYAEMTFAKTKICDTNVLCFFINPKHVSFPAVRLLS